MSIRDNPKRYMSIVDENNNRDEQAMQAFCDGDFFGPVYFDKDENMYIVDYRARFLPEDGLGIEEVLMPQEAWSCLRKEQAKMLKDNQRLKVVRVVNDL